MNVESSRCIAAPDVFLTEDMDNMISQNVMIVGDMGKQSRSEV